MEPTAHNKHDLPSRLRLPFLQKLKNSITRCRAEEGRAGPRPRHLVLARRMTGVATRSIGHLSNIVRSPGPPGTLPVHTRMHVHAAVLTCEHPHLERPVNYCRGCQSLLEGLAQVYSWSGKGVSIDHTSCEDRRLPMESLTTITSGLGGVRGSAWKVLLDACSTAPDAATNTGRRNLTGHVIHTSA